MSDGNSNIATLLDKILQAIYGKDVRQSIHDAIQQCYEDVGDPTLNEAAFKKAVDDAIADGTLTALTIADKSITGTKIADETITKDKLASDIDIGLNQTAKDLLISILENAVFVSNQATNITALKTALSGIDENSWPIIQNLSGALSSNRVTSVTKNSSFTTTITPDINYTLSSVTVTMAGTDITSTAYSNGVITISNVIGSVVINAIGTKESGNLLPSNGLISKFDFRNISPESYNLINWGNVYRIEPEYGEYFCFNTKSWTPDEKGISNSDIRDLRYVSNPGVSSPSLGSSATIFQVSCASYPIPLKMFKGSNILHEVIFAPQYVSTDGSTKAGSDTTIHHEEPLPASGYYYYFGIVFEEKIAKIYIGEKLCLTYDASKIPDFDHWVTQPSLVNKIFGAFDTAGYTTAGVLYNRGLSTSEMSDLYNYYKTMIEG